MKTIYSTDGTVLELKFLQEIRGRFAYMRSGSVHELNETDIGSIDKARKTSGRVHIANGINLNTWADEIATAKQYRIITVIGTNTLNGVSVTNKQIMFRSDGTWQTEWSGPQVFDLTFDLTFE